MKLPKPSPRGSLSLEEAIEKRRSEREFSPQSLSLREISQILWAAQGVSGAGGFGRTCPSAGALYPLEIYVEVRKTEGLEPGVYNYDVFQHALELTSRGDCSQELADACLSQLFIAEAPVVFLIAAEYGRVTWKYGERGLRYVYLEAGHCCQNICLQVTALGLSAVPVGAFWDRQVQRVLALPQDVEPVYLVPVGRSPIRRRPE